MARAKQAPHEDIFKFTPASVNAAVCPPGRAQAFYRDSVQPALKLRVTQGGSRTFVFEKKLAGQTLRIAIGDATVMPIRAVKDTSGAPLNVAADSEAQRLALLVMQGIDPRRQKAEAVAAQEAGREAARAEGVAREVEAAAREVEAARRRVTGLTVWATYCADRPGWGALHRRDHLQMAAAGGEPRKRSKVAFTAPGPLFALLNQPIAELDAAAIAAWLRAESKTRPTKAALAFRLLRAFLNWASEHPEYRGIADPAAHAGKRVREAVPRRRAKSDVLQREMLKGWFIEVAKLSPAMSAALQVMLLTGCRPGEALDMCWRDIDFKWQRLTLRDKVVGERTVPLTQYVAKLLLELRRVNSIRPNLPRRLDGDAAAQAEHEKWEPSPWVFVSRVRTGERVTDPSSAHGRALAAAGLPHMSMHGLRRSFGTLSEWCECPVGVVAQVQGHAPSAIAEQHYRVRPLDLLRMWHQRIESWILAEAGIEPAAANEPNRPALALVQK